ncbi:hypothetical protein ACHAXR_002596 [Thalassiosira sp. AJA248-18]
MMLLCGRVVGHNPDGALSGKAERDEATREALEDRCPNYDKEIWGVETIADTSSDDEEGEDESMEEDNGHGPNPNNGITNNAAMSNHTTNNDTIRIRIRDSQTSEEMPFTINKTIEMERVFNDYAALKGVPISHLYFYLHRHHRYSQMTVKHENTPANLGLRDNQILHVRYVSPNAPIVIRVKDQNGEETMFKIKRTTKLKLVFSKFAARKGVETSNLRFLLDGETICHDETPVSLELEDDDQIDVILIQCGC